MNEIENLIRTAIDRLIANDGDLLRNDVNERAITHRFACYLQELFPEWNVDCEYNRHHDQKKTLKEYRRRKVNIDDTNGTTVFPDIIVHKRMTEDNLLVIEVKKSTNLEPDKLDLEKLAAFKHEIGYKNALFLRLKTGKADIGEERFQWV